MASPQKRAANDDAAAQPNKKSATAGTQNGKYKYHPGFGSYVVSEALPNALPPFQNNPQKCAYGLYAEQLSGTAFTKPRHQNQFSWLYRIRPSVCHTPYKPLEHKLLTATFTDFKPFPDQLRWSPFDLPTTPGVDWVRGLTTLAGAGNAATRNGVAIHIYSANADMVDTAFYNADGDFLIGMHILV